MALILALAAPAAALDADSIGRVTASARRREKVLVEVTLKRALTLDRFLATDGTGEVFLDATGLRHDLKVGDRVVVWGRYMGRSDHDANVSELEALSLAPSGSEEAGKLLLAHGRPAPSPSPSVAPSVWPSPSPRPSIESRLREVDDLTEKGLITTEERRRIREKILSEL